MKMNVFVMHDIIECIRDQNLLRHYIVFSIGYVVFCHVFPCEKLLENILFHGRPPLLQLDDSFRIPRDFDKNIRCFKDLGFPTRTFFNAKFLDKTTH